MDNDYGLDLHSLCMLDEYRSNYDSFVTMKSVVESTLRNAISESGLFVTALESRIKTESSLAGKLELKGGKYNSLSDITDIIGARIIVFYTDDIDKIAAIVENFFDVDWDNSVDKRKMHSLDSFGYMSVHYICRIPKTLYHDPAHPEINSFRWELQLRTALQHVWANLNHDTGYKSGVEVPQDYLRRLSCLAGMLELADNEFSRIRTSINDYRRQVQALVMDGRFEEVQLNADTFKSFLDLHPFDKLTKRIAAINQAEIHEVSIKNYLELFKVMGFTTLGDLDNLIRNYSEQAFQLARYEIGKTDLDIISSNVSVQDLCIVYILMSGKGEKGLEEMFNVLSDAPEYNAARAKRVYETARHLPFMQQN